MPKDPKNDRHILQWEDLSRQGQKIVSDNMQTVGETLPDRVSTGIAKAKVSKNKKAPQTLRALEAIEPHVRSEKVTLQKAANSRQRLYRDAQIRQQASGNPDNVIPEGADWYFEHHARITHDAEQMGFPGHWARTGSAVMSPQNSPENERASIRAIMDATAHSKVEITPDVSHHLKSHGYDVSEHLGTTIRVDQLPTGALGALSDKDFQPRVNTDANLKDVARGGTKVNVKKAEEVVRGETRPEDAVVNANGAITGTKVASYDHVINSSVPGSAEHVEFMGRVHHDALVRAGRISADQGALDLYGLGDKELPRDHILSPQSHTVEDTWQNSVTFNQPKVLAGEKSRTSVFKTGGSGDQYPPTGLKTERNDEGKQIGTAHPDPRFNDGAVLHAYNNEATQKAAAQQGRGSGVTLPPVAMQGVVWTEARRQSGKSRESGNAEASGDRDLTHEEARTEVDVFHRMGRTVPQRPAPEPSKFEQQYPGHVQGQGSLFDLSPEMYGSHVSAAAQEEHQKQWDSIPGARRAASLDDEGEGMSDSEKEADLRKWQAIGNNVRRSKRRR